MVIVQLSIFCLFPSVYMVYRKIKSEGIILKAKKFRALAYVTNKCFRNKTIHKVLSNRKILTQALTPLLSKMWHHKYFLESKNDFFLFFIK